MKAKKTLHKLVVSHLVNKTPYGSCATPAQLNAAAKKIIRSGYLPAPVAEQLGLGGRA